MEYTYTKQMIELRRNACLPDILMKLNPKSKIMLEDEDYLNPYETIQMYKMGIDIQFMVEHCGGSIKSSEKDGDSDVEPDFDYADLLESSEGSFD